jgi:hypothetical protein
MPSCGVGLGNPILKLAIPTSKTNGTLNFASGSGVRDNAKARLATLSCLEFQMQHIPFRSVIVHEDFENGLSKKDQSRITNVADKQFTSLADFQTNAEGYFQRELGAVQ